MKILVLTFLCVVSTLLTVAQNKTLGVGTPTPNPNAALHVESPTNNQGFIMPRLTTVQRTGMATLLTTADNGLMLYDTDLKTIYIWDGATWKSTAQVAGGSKLSYPYEDIVTTNPGTVDLFALKYNATDNARVMRIENQSVTNGSSALSVLNQGVGLAGYFQVDNAASGSSALYGTTNSNLGGALAPVGVYGESTGTGSLAAAFRINNTASTFPAVYAETNGSGPTINARNIGTTNGFAGLFQNASATNAFPAIQANSNGTGSAIRAFQGPTNGDGPGMDIFMQKPTSTSSGLVINGNHAGEGVRLNMNTTTSTASGINVNQQGLGVGANFTINNAANSGNAIQVQTNGTGSAGSFTITNPANGKPALLATSNSNNNSQESDAIRGVMTGTGGAAGSFTINNSASSIPALYGETNGTGAAGFIQVKNPANTDAALFALTNSNAGGAGVVGHAIGTQASGGAFRNLNAANPWSALYAFTSGTGAATLSETSTGYAAIHGKRDGATNGNAGLFDITDAANTFPALKSNTVGTGSAGNFSITNASNSSPALFATTNGTGNAITAVGKIQATQFIGDGSLLAGVVSAPFTFPYNTPVNTATIAFDISNTGAGGAGNFKSNNAASTGYALVGESNGAALSAGVFGNNTGTGFGVFGKANGSAFGSAAVYGEQIGTGDAAGAFRISNASNTLSALYGETNGSGSSVYGYQLGTGRAGLFQIDNAPVTQQMPFMRLPMERVGLGDLPLTIRSM